MNRKNRYWSTEEKLKMITPVMQSEISYEEQGRKYDVSSGLLANWVKAYKEKGIEGLANKRRPGNPLVKYSRKKNLTTQEQLEYENMQLRIENERLKKGYFVKGDGTVQISTWLKKENSK